MTEAGHAGDRGCGWSKPRSGGDQPPAPEEPANPRGGLTCRSGVLSAVFCDNSPILISTHLDRQQLRTWVAGVVQRSCNDDGTQTEKGICGKSITPGGVFSFNRLRRAGWREGEARPDVEPGVLQLRGSPCTAPAACPATRRRTAASAIPMHHHGSFTSQAW